MPWLRQHRRELPTGLVERWGQLPTLEPEQTVLDCLAVLDRSAGVRPHPERVLARALRLSGLTGFRLNQPVHGYVADLLDDKRRLILEVDGWAAHRDRQAFQGANRTRQNVLVVAGYTVLRYTANDVGHRLEEVVAQVHDVIARLDRRKCETTTHLTPQTAR